MIAIFSVGRCELCGKKIAIDSVQTKMLRANPRFAAVCEQCEELWKRKTLAGSRAAMRTYIAEHAQLELRPIGRPRSAGKSKVSEKAEARALRGLLA